MTTLDHPSDRQASTSVTAGRRRSLYPPRHKPGDDRVVMIDVDGVLARLDAYEAALTADDRTANQRWEEFFTHIPDAEVIDTGYDLACAVDSLGYTLVYSTTRPPYTRDATRSWLTAHQFPPGRALLTRADTAPGLHPQPAWQTKLAHTRAVTNRHPAWLRVFVDDDPAILAKLTAAGIPAVDADALTGLTTAGLRAALDEAARRTERHAGARALG